MVSRSQSLEVAQYDWICSPPHASFLPPPLVPVAAKRDSYLALRSNRIWRDRKFLRVAPWGDYTAQQWEELVEVVRGPLGPNSACGLPLVFGHRLDAVSVPEIRVGFHPLVGSWSAVGTAVLECDPLQPTTNLALDGLTEEERQGVIVHEMLHALGCIHEHQSPKLVIPWDREKVYAYYLETRGWDSVRVDDQIFRRYDEEDVWQKEGDPTSVMCYPVEQFLLKPGAAPIRRNNVMSRLDRLRLSEQYGPP